MHAAIVCFRAQGPVAARPSGATATVRCSAPALFVHVAVCTRICQPTLQEFVADRWQSCAQFEEFVEQTLRIVELDVIRGSLVGMPGIAGLTGEQFKRLTIAVELVANPSIIFCGAPRPVLLQPLCGFASRCVLRSARVSRAEGSP